MSSDIRRIPFSELFERLKNELVRDSTSDSATENKYKGRINDTYMFALPSQIEYRHIAKSTYITTTADYSTGYITDASATTLTGDGDCDWTSAISNNMLIKIGGYDELYRITYVSATSLTIDKTWVGDAIAATDTTYLLFQDRYALASDFERMIQDPDKCVFYWNAGNKVYLKYKEPEEFEERQTWTVGEPSYYTVKWINDDPYLFVDPPATASFSIYYKYIPSLAKMTEYTTGTITTLANGGIAVTGSGSDFDGFVSDTTNYTYYFRIDSDGTGSKSKWYKITSAGSNTAITLSDAYEGTAIVAGTSAYTISKVSLLPAGLDLAILYGAAIVSSTEQDNVNQSRTWSSIFDNALSPYKAIENKTKYGKQRMKTIYEKAGVRR